MTQLVLYFQIINKSNCKFFKKYTELFAIFYVFNSYVKIITSNASKTKLLQYSNKNC